MNAIVDIGWHLEEWVQMSPRHITGLEKIDKPTDAMKVVKGKLFTFFGILRQS